MLTNEYSKYENSYDPKKSHKDHLRRIVKRWFGIFPDGDGCFEAYIDASDVGIALAIVNKSWN